MGARTPRARMGTRPVTENDDALLAQAHELCRSVAFREAVWRHHRHRANGATLDALSTRIHPDDQMLRHSLRHWAEVNYSASQYFNVALQQHEAQQQLLRLAFGARAGAVDILDFACGFGRSLRFLTQSPARGRIWASDVQREAVDFVVREFGVHGLYSSYGPGDFRPDHAFDFVWVASLFSHLPERLFRAWLRQLATVLAPQGVVCFSVHDECLLARDEVLGEGGIKYVPASEIEELDSRAYGTSHVNEAFVATAIAEAFGQPRPNYVRLRRGLANEQDLYVVAKDPARELAPLRAFRKGAWGFVDRFGRDAAGDFTMLGWAASLDDGPVARVTVRLDGGAPLDCTTGLAREDVAGVLQDERLRTSGWSFAHPVARPEVFVDVSAETAAGETALLYAGSVRVPEAVVAESSRRAPPPRESLAARAWSWVRGR
jgi:SAM-dependent methyltransferase